MSEKEKTAPSKQPEFEAADKPDANTNRDDEKTVKVKFNKEEKEIEPEKAKTLIQKGLKYELIEDDYLSLKDMADESGLPVTEFLKNLQKSRQSERLNALKEQAGGNEELAKRVIDLENKNKPENKDFKELQSEFPEIKEIGELPQEVIENSSVKGSRLLDEYLRYLHKKSRKEAAKQHTEKENLKAGVGSQKSEDTAAEQNEFIKGIWNR